MGYTALQFHGREMTVQFEYQVLDSLMFDRRRKDLEAQLNELGREGWEMVATCAAYTTKPLCLCAKLRRRQSVGQGHRQKQRKIQHA